MNSQCRGTLFRASAKFRQRGFTLLELLVVVAILVALAGGVILSVSDTEQQAAEQITHSEITEIKKAVLQFEQDTGWLPKQGPFDLMSNGGQLDPANSNHWPAFLADRSADYRIDWFNSPANHYQLMAFNYPTGDNNQGPLAGTAHPLRDFNINARRGWRGPYLQRRGAQFVSIGNGLNLNGSGTPRSGSLLLKNVPGVADRFRKEHISASFAGPVYQWTTQSGRQLSRAGRPYLLFDVHLTNRNDLVERARLMSLGPNGEYESNASGPGGDDIVLYLFK